MACITCNQEKGLFCCNSKSLKRVCIETKRVFDACIQKVKVEDAILDVNFPVPPPANAIVTVIANSGPAVLTDLMVEPVQGNPCSRVSYTLTIPVMVTAVDNANNTYTGTSSYVVTSDILLKVPPSTPMLPVTVEVQSGLTGVAVSLSDGILVADLCILILNKAVALVILSIPTYGYPFIPECTAFSDDVCRGVFTQPIFPSTTTLT